MPSERSTFLAPRRDLGVRTLVPEWRALISKDHVERDVMQGLNLACTTLPLAALLAAFAGAPASSGVIAAVLGSLMCVFFGGTRVALSGPGLASGLVVASVLADHGLAALGLAVLASGLLQVATGALGLGRYARLVPVTVVRGSVVGIGLSILLLQLPLALGQDVSPADGLLERLDLAAAQWRVVDPLVLEMAAAAGILGALSLYQRVPGVIIGVIGSSWVAFALCLEVPSLHELEQLPTPTLPWLSSSGVAQIAGAALQLFGVATVSTLVGTLALEEIDAHPTDGDQELIANGGATVLGAFFGAMPTTQFVARSVLGVKAEVRSRRASLVQAAIVLAVGIAAFPLMKWVPLAGLTGAAVAVAVPLLDPRPLHRIGRVSRSELAVGVTTVATTLFGGVALGIGVGLALSFATSALGLTRTRALLHTSPDASAPLELSFSGPLTFLATLEIAELRAGLARHGASGGLVVDLRSVLAVDATSALALVAVLDDVRARGTRVALVGPSAPVRERLLAADALPRRLAADLVPGGLAGTIAVNARQAHEMLGTELAHIARPRLLAGLRRFREEMKPRYDSLFESLADGQHPHTMFVTCADSRIDPAMLMGSHPGDLFIVRALGALVAPANHTAMFQEGAAVEYGVGVLGIRHIVVCGHSQCGAINALKKGNLPAELGALGRWARHAAPLVGDLGGFADADAAARAVTVRQVEHLRSYPLVRERHDKGELHIHAWFYDLGAVDVFEWDPATGRFGVVGGEPQAAPAKVAT